MNVPVGVVALWLIHHESGRSETDFYVYRYLGNEGFLPGYNFPRLPVRALVSTGTEAQSIERAIFLALVEFGPGNILYYEGRKHCVASVVVPAGGIEARLTRAKLCNSCGYVHPSDNACVDLCVHCGTRLTGANSQFPQAPGVRRSPGSSLSIPTTPTAPRPVRKGARSPRW